MIYKTKDGKIYKKQRINHSYFRMISYKHEVTVTEDKLEEEWEEISNGTILSGNCGRYGVVKIIQIGEEYYLECVGIPSSFQGALSQEEWEKVLSVSEEMSEVSELGERIKPKLYLAAEEAQAYFNISTT